MSDTANQTPNPQEADLLIRSVKRIKGDGNPPIAEEYQLYEAPPKQLSYRDMVSCLEPVAILCDSSNREEILDEDSDYEDDGSIPTILISKEEKRRIRMPWLNSIIIKAFGTKRAGYNFILPRIKAQWKPRGKMDCIDLGLDFFLIRFHEKEDLNRVLHGGPWFVDPHFLTIRKWEPSFDPAKATFTTTAIWARLPRLPIECYDVQILQRIGNMLGTPLRLDAHTTHQSRGQYARICVQVDLDEPWYLLYVLANMSKRFFMRDLLLYATPMAQTSQTSIDGNCNEPPANQGFGPWMLVERRKNKKKVRTKTIADKAIVSDKISLSPFVARGKASSFKKYGSQPKISQNVRNHPFTKSTPSTGTSDHGSNHLHQARSLVGCTANQQEQSSNPNREGVVISPQQESGVDRGMDIGNDPELLAESHSYNERSISQSFSSPTNGRDSSTSGTPVSRLMHPSEGYLDDRMHEDSASGGHEGGSIEFYAPVPTDCATLLLPKSQYDGYEQGRSVEVAPGSCQLAGERVKKAAKALRFPKKVIVDSDGFAGGIWLLWDDTKYTIDILNVGPQAIHANVQQSFPCSNRKPFRLEKFWLEHESFKDLVASNWTSPNLSISDCSIVFQNNVKLWSRATFDNLHKKKKKLIVRLGGIQQTLQSKNSSFLIDLEKTLSKEYQDILKYEKDMWFMKSRLQWIQNGDRNTKFFHVSTLKRRSYYRILGLKDDTGSWITDATVIESIITSYFKSLYKTSFLKSSHDSYSSVQSAPFIDPSCWHGLIDLPSEFAIKHALFAMKPFKAPSPDGLHVAFFQKYFLILKERICLEIRDIFNSGIILESWSASLTTLIPKNNKPDSVSHFRPIGLCNTSYKIVKKIIVFCLKNLIGELISPMQSSFIPGRNGQNINQEKSKILFFANVNPDIKLAICHTLGYMETPSLGKYLGFPITFRRIKKSDCNFIVDKVKSKLAGWKANMLSLAGRDYSQPRKAEGIGIRVSSEVNQAAMAKLHWRMITEVQKPWAKAFISKYKIDLPYHNFSRSSSPICKDIPKGKDIVDKGISWVPPNGSKINFWQDRWILKESLCSVFYGPFRPHDLDITDIIQKTMAIAFQRHSAEQDSFRCPRCRNGPETLTHIFRECQYAALFWNSIIPQSISTYNQNLDFKSWIKVNVGVHNSPPSSSTWPTVFSYAVWSIWYSRNQLVHDNKHISIFDLKCSTLDRAQEFIRLQPALTTFQPKTIVSVGWSPPSPGFAKLNTDGSALTNPGIAGAGGLLRDHLGRWMVGFSRSIGWTTSIAAELWAIRDGLEIAAGKGISKTIVETDSKVAVLLIESIDTTLHSLGTLISDCRWLLRLFTDARISHIYREANAAADFLAKLGSTSANDFVLYEESPPGLSSILYHDLIGTSFPRTIVAS
ncbi:hypothetical protein SLEP1_g33477 [Rubroshorea leprosula]|uniref:RNase H type-1 domain-containing protein n=1 Tax=Rubroshorea leprosula TaxID=152421 RepID=A0AAV5KGQ4_9ROSI|nr:hypothetical protein SLEP1_g33477 [Rubroshorea leprosula]